MNSGSPNISNNPKVTRKNRGKVSQNSQNPSQNPSHIQTNPQVVQQPPQIWPQIITYPQAPMTQPVYYPNVQQQWPQGVGNFPSNYGFSQCGGHGSGSGSWQGGSSTPVRASTPGGGSSTNQNVNEERRMDEIFQQVAYTVVPRLLQDLTPTPRPSRRRVHGRDRDREGGHTHLFNDYFSEHPVFNDRLFRRRFRMRRDLFVRIMEAVTSSDEWFQQRRDAAGRLGLSPLQKCTAAIRMLTYGMAADATDEYVRISETTARAALHHFTLVVIRQFGNQYLRRPTPEDLERILAYGEDRGFPGMIGSIDCMHWEWKNCPTAWKGQFQGRDGVPTLVLEAVADRDLWIWHSFFGVAGSCNDLNVLYRSPVFDDLLDGRAPSITFTVNGNQYNKGYYLTDGIYPKWSTFVKSIPSPQTPKDRLYSERQESVRKDVERAFGVLQARFAIVRQPSLAWDRNILHNIMMSCIIMHNIIVEDERDSYAHYMDTT